jgi:hypothetical protein
LKELKEYIDTHTGPILVGSSDIVMIKNLYPSYHMDDILLNPTAVKRDIKLNTLITKENIIMIEYSYPNREFWNVIKSRILKLFDIFENLPVKLIIYNHVYRDVNTGGLSVGPNLLNYKCRSVLIISDNKLNIIKDI